MNCFDLIFRIDSERKSWARSNAAKSKESPWRKLFESVRNNLRLCWSKKQFEAENRWASSECLISKDSKTPPLRNSCLVNSLFFLLAWLKMQNVSMVREIVSPCLLLHVLKFASFSRKNFRVFSFLEFCLYRSWSIRFSFSWISWILNYLYFCCSEFFPFFWPLIYFRISIAAFACFPPVSMSDCVCVLVPSTCFLLDMCEFMKSLVTNYVPTTKTRAAKGEANPNDLTVEERSLLSVAYKNVIGARRSSWRTLQVDDDTKTAEEKEVLATYRQQIEAELDNICKQVLALLNQRLLVVTKDNHDEAEVFYLKMYLLFPLITAFSRCCLFRISLFCFILFCCCYSGRRTTTGPFSYLIHVSYPLFLISSVRLSLAISLSFVVRYLAEFMPTPENLENARTNYVQALNIAQQSLPTTHPIRLGLALNFSVCYFEILKRPTDACQLAQQAFNDGIRDLETVEDPNLYKESTLILQLLYAIPSHIQAREEKFLPWSFSFVFCLFGSV